MHIKNFYYVDERSSDGFQIGIYQPDLKKFLSLLKIKTEVGVYGPAARAFLTFVAMDAAAELSETETTAEILAKEFNAEEYISELINIELRLKLLKANGYR